MMLFLKLLLAHFLGDFVLQPEKWIKHKEKKKIKSNKLYFHIVIHFTLLLIATDFNTNNLIGIILITISHYIIDLGKLYFQSKKNKALLFFIDQTLHIIMLFVVTHTYHPIHFYIPSLITYNTILLASCLIFVSFVSAVLIKVIISQWNPEKDENKTNHSLAKAGKFIGILERLFVFVFVIMGKWEGIGFLLAAKSVFRFGDLSSAKDRKLTEYILIGTLLSFGLAILTGLVYSHYGR